eukprot:8059950-Heterocapsa_arctica.AAC.1
MFDAKPVSVLKCWQKRARRKSNKAVRTAEIRAFGDRVTVDHLVRKNDVSAGIDVERLGMVILDHAKASTSYLRKVCG